MTIDKNKDEISQEDLKKGVKTFERQTKSHPALETADGKNSGAKPAAFRKQRSNHP